ncbi:MAG: HAD family hydrolase [Candidatus Thermoplasmatota archaeon]|nr:HAD family hydrolase [Candidatus Thermoplasmatota archaeon]
MREIAAVTFDLWDTLIQEHPGGSNRVARIRVEEISSILSSAGSSHTAEEIMAAHDRTGIFLRSVWLKSRDVPIRDQVLFMLDSIDERLPGRLRSEHLQSIENVYSESILENMPGLLPGARQVLEEIKESGYRTGLISNTGRTPGSALRMVMDRLQILEFFDTTTFSNEILIRKPADGAFKMTLKMLKVAPGEAVHVGDDPESDVAGAKRAGMRAIQVVTDDRERSFDADFTVSSLEIVPDIIRRL